MDLRGRGVPQGMAFYLGAAENRRELISLPGTQEITDRGPYILAASCSVKGTQE